MRDRVFHGLLRRWFPLLEPNLPFSQDGRQHVPFIIGLFAGPLGIVLAATRLAPGCSQTGLVPGRGPPCASPPPAPASTTCGIRMPAFDSDRIVSHNAYGTDTTDGWNDLRVVSSDCFHYGRGQSSAELRLLFGSGRALVLTIANPAVRAKSDELRSAMARTGYRYRPDGSINDQTCPPGTLPRPDGLAADALNAATVPICGFRRKPPTYSDLMPPIVLT